MAALKPMRVPAGPLGRSSSWFLNAIRLMILVTLAGGSAYLMFAHREWFADPTLVKTEVVSWGVWGPIVYMVLYAVGPSFLVPGAVMTIAGGLAFGVFWGSLWSLVGADVGAVVAFAAGRFLGRAFVERMFGLRFHDVLKRLARNGFYLTLYLRIVPVIPYNAFNLLAGASPIGFRDYFWASMLGMIPGTVLFALLGDALWHPTSPRFFVAVGLIALCFILGELYRRWKSIQIDS
jgi:uncharacterized membrane protein YdjX (TVP38/TMEM64 family)